MRKTILTFGLISGAISSLMMVATASVGDRIGFDKGVVIGYTTIVLSFLLVFFGIRSNRDNIGNGQISSEPRARVLQPSRRSFRRWQRKRSCITTRS
jgi:hypothetical protein